MSLQKKTDSNNQGMLALIEDSICSTLELFPAVEPLRSAVHYAVFPGGKRIRPLLGMLFFADLGENPADFADAGVSLELIHNSSLIHDDLPAMDNDDFRRGKLSCHKKFGEATAILAGDLLVALALYNITGLDFDSEIKARLTVELSKTYMELCSGQQLDILPEQERGKLKVIHQLKTGALFRAALVFPAICARLSETQISLAARAGLSIGESFQIMDDFIDSSSEKKRRPAGSDRKNCKTTALNGNGQIKALLAGPVEDRESALKELEASLLQEGRDVSFTGTRAAVEEVLRG